MRRVIPCPARNADIIALLMETYRAKDTFTLLQIVSFCKQHSDCSGDGADDKDEQLHVMPLCVLDPNCGDDEAPSIEERIRLGAVEQLTSYPVVERVRYSVYSMQ